jgi:hypothetical protein
MIFNEIPTNLSVDRILVYPLFSSLSRHPAQTELSCLFISDGEVDCCINYKNLDVEPFCGELDFSRYGEVFVVDLKSFLYHYSCGENFYDLPAHLFYNAVEWEINEPKIYNIFRRRGIPKICDIIPILIHYDVFNQWKVLFNDVNSKSTKFSNLYPKSLYAIEKNGVYTTNGLEMTQYNFLTSTSRPSNTFNGINYAALKKGDDTRKRFISRFDGGKLFSFDYDGYHIRLIGNLIGNPIPTDISAHNWLGQQYGVPMEQAKPITFRQLYGGVQDEYKHIPFYESVSTMVDGLWDEYSFNSYTRTPIFKRIMKKLPEMNKNKLFNYILQALETERNIFIINKLSKQLEGYKSVPVLYNYESILFDVSDDEMDTYPQKVKEIMELGGYPVKVEVGDDYKNMFTV